MKKGYILFAIAFLLFGCEPQYPEITYPSPFTGTDKGKVKLSMDYPKDNNGYYRVTLNPNKEYNYTSIFVEASRITNSRYIYNGISVIEGKFDSNSYWIIGENLAVTLPLYNPFRSLYSSPYFRTPILVGTKTIILSQFENQIVPLVPETGIYFKEYDPRMDTYKPSSENLWSKKIIGPIPYKMKGDTIKIYCKVSWECGNYSLTYPDRTNIIDSLKIIFQ
jgi:hypothetical protein